MKNIKNILVATDFTPDSRIALNEAMSLAEKFQSTVYVLHAVDKIQECAADYCLNEEQIEAEKTKLFAEAKMKLDSEIERFKDFKGVSIVSDLRYGRVFDEILNEEKEKNIDLLVIGPHANKSLWQQTISHLSDKLVKNSLCDTLVVRHAA